LKVADIYVINTCSVTECRQTVQARVVKKTINDKTFVAAVGCYAELKPEKLAAVDGVDLVLSYRKFKITDYINDLSKSKKWAGATFLQFKLTFFM
jgi:threonylcarbamoyladenosine tRNA methylthiotransferase MtaB